MTVLLTFIPLLLPYGRPLTNQFTLRSSASIMLVFLGFEGHLSFHRTLFHDTGLGLNNSGCNSFRLCASNSSMVAKGLCGSADNCDKGDEALNVQARLRA